MLLVLTYHQVFRPEASHLWDKFKTHLCSLAKQTKIVIPGEKISGIKKLSVCLTFDDAYYDFYKFVFPLLKSLNIKAILSIPTRFILPDSTTNELERLSVPYPTGLDADINTKTSALCTWAEIKEMVVSGLVIPASHSHTHANLTKPETDLKLELAHSKYVLEEKLQTEINSFVFPFGAMNNTALAFSKNHYQYQFRLGGAINFGWEHGLIYRVVADNLWQKDINFNLSFLTPLMIKFGLNRLRNK